MTPSYFFFRRNPHSPLEASKYFRRYGPVFFSRSHPGWTWRRVGPNLYRRDKYLKWVGYIVATALWMYLATAAVVGTME